MAMRIDRHTVVDERIVAATDDFPRRVAALVDAEQEGGPSGIGWSIITGVLLDYVGARSVDDPDLSDLDVRLALRSAGETATGAVMVAARPSGERLAVTVPYTGTGVSYGPDQEPVPPPALMDWLTAWKLAWICRPSTFVPLTEARRVLPDAGSGDPPNRRLHLAQAEAMFHDQFMRPAEGAAVLDRALHGAPDADAVLVAELTALRSLLARDRDGFHRDLAELLHRHRAAAQAADPGPASLVPVGPLSLACLAADDTGWDIDIESGYLPRSVLTRDWTR
ncbi:immunity 49 family protein [Dactylosporangium sp. NPDC049742]|uniref:immunity 49 family protein n=1 Tax=Dactylosporangium sp. NPDC049742 TaxID=3154737 RepID=UPI003433407B